MTFLQVTEWSERRGLNPRPPAPKAGALPGCATLRKKYGRQPHADGHRQAVTDDENYLP